MGSTTGVLDQKMRRSFAMLDIDGDGHLVQSDMLALADRLAAAFGMSEDTAKINRLRSSLSQLWTKDFSAIAADSSGLNCTEYVAGMRKAVDNDQQGVLERLSEMIAAWMDIADTDGNGLIDEEEYITMYSKTLGATREDLKVAFARLDLDGNGTLDHEEIHRAAIEYCSSDDPQAPGNWLFGSL